MVVREILLEGRRLHCIYCRGDKSPAGPHGWHSATADPAELARLGWAALIGVATGKINNIVAVDVDPRHGGDKTLAEKLAWLPETRRHRTMSGGEHWIYQYPEAGIPNFTGTDSNGLPGIELKSDGLGVVWPPSRGYSVIDDRPVAECPVRLIALVKTLRPAPRPRGEGSGASLITSDWQPQADYEVPPPLYIMADRLTSCPQHKRRVIGVLRPLVRTARGRNKVLFNKAVCFRYELIPHGIITIEAAGKLLFMAAQINGYLAKRGDAKVWSTIRSGLGVINEAPLPPHPQEPDHD
jgi:hypothetical protein